MKILAVETSANTVGVAVCEDEAVLASFTGNLAKTHSQTLLPIIDGLLSYAGLSANDIDLFATTQGPGSFTGIRIGISTVKGLAFGKEKAIVGISSLLAMAYAFSDREGAMVCPVINARRGDVYCAIFRVEGGMPVRITEDTCMHARVLEEKLSEYDTVYFCGDGTAVLKREMQTRKVQCENELLRYPSGVTVAKAALDAYRDGHYTTDKDLLPVYLKPSQAEQERASKGKDRGGTYGRQGSAEGHRIFNTHIHIGFLQNFRRYSPFFSSYNEQHGTAEIRLRAGNCITYCRTQYTVAGSVKKFTKTFGRRSIYINGFCKSR